MRAHTVANTTTNPCTARSLYIYHPLTLCSGAGGTQAARSPTRASVSASTAKRSSVTGSTPAVSPKRGSKEAAGSNDLAAVAAAAVAAVAAAVPVLSSTSEPMTPFEQWYSSPEGNNRQRCNCFSYMCVHIYTHTHLCCAGSCTAACLQ
jgi:hypothetical protein